MGGDCNCTWKCARSRFAVVYGVLSIVRVLIEFQNYLIGDTEDDDVQNHAAPIISIYTLIILLAHFLYSIALIYSVLKIDAKFMIIIIGYTIFEIVCIVLLILYYIVSTARDNIAKECCLLLFNFFMLYILYKIRDDIRADKSQLPPVYYDPEPIPSGSTPYPQIPQQVQQSFVPANPYYAQLPQQYSPVPVNSFYPPTMQPQPLDPNMCPPTIQPQPLGPNMYPPLPQIQLPQPSAPFNQINNV